MGKVYEALSAKQLDFIRAQKLFFVASAPLAASGHVNVSPKGMDSLRVLDSTTVAYLDLTGSGVETIAHVKENGRLVIMFCAFEGSPLILRLHGRAEVLEPGNAEFGSLLGAFPELPAVRSIIRMNVERIADSCGWTVPLYDFAGMRDYYQTYADRQGPEGIRKAQLASNLASIDGLSGLRQPTG
jgi:hypothetical protein